MSFVVVGAGMAGLLAGAILREECARIFEAQPDLPNNHHALLRFRSSIVGDTLNIPFRSVKVLKAVASSCGNPVGRYPDGTIPARALCGADIGFFVLFCFSVLFFALSDPFSVP